MLGQFRGLDLRVAEDRDVADLRARAFVDDERQREPVFVGVVVQLAADLGLHEAQVAVVGRQAVDVLVDLLAVDVALEEPDDRRLRLDLRAQPGVAGDRVAHEAHPEHALLGAFVHDVDRPRVGDLVALEHDDAGLGEAVLVVVFLDLAAAFLDSERVQRVAGLEARLFQERARPHLVAADDADLAERGPLDDLEDHEPAALHALRQRLDVDAQAAAVEPADVFLDQRGVEGTAGPRANMGEKLCFGDVLVALEADLDDHLRDVGRRRDHAAGRGDRRDGAADGRHGRGGPTGERLRGGRQRDRQQPQTQQGGGAAAEALHHGRSGHPWRFPCGWIRRFEEEVSRVRRGGAWKSASFLTRGDERRSCRNGGGL